MAKLSKYFANEIQNERYFRIIMENFYSQIYCGRDDGMQKKLTL